MDNETRAFLRWLVTQIDGASASADSWMSSGDLLEAGYYSGRGAAFIHALQWWHLRVARDDSDEEFIERVKGEANDQ